MLRCEYWLDAANERAWLIADTSTVSQDPHSATACGWLARLAPCSICAALAALAIC